MTWVLVGLVGFEPTTPALSRRCSNQLSYRPSNHNYEDIAYSAKMQNMQALGPKTIDRL
jgi:hypothetical protein